MSTIRLGEGPPAPSSATSSRAMSFGGATRAEECDETTPVLRASSRSPRDGSLTASSSSAHRARSFLGPLVSIGTATVACAAVLGAAAFAIGGSRRLSSTGTYFPTAQPWEDGGRESSRISADDAVWASRFEAASALLGIPSSFETDADYDKLRAWTYARFEPSWTGAYSYGSTIGGVELRYYPVFKSANNNIRHSLDVMSPVEEDSLNGTAAALAAAFESRASVGRREDVERGGFDKCKFTFIRDPLARFVSAYSEFEFRTSAKLKLHMGDSCPDPADWTMVAFDTSNMVDRIAANVQADSWWPPLVGTTERAALALKLIASLRWVDQRAKRDVTQDPAPVRRAFNCLVAFHHFFPQSSNFVATAPYRVDASTEKTQTPLNFVGKLERFDEDWDKLADTCGVTPASALRYDPLPNGGGHPETSDNDAQAAMQRYLEGNDDAMVAFCLLYLDDYAWGGYELPRACAESSTVMSLL